MPYDLSPLTDYLNDTSPMEIAKVLDNAMKHRVHVADCHQSTEGLEPEYFDLQRLRDVFALIAFLRIGQHGDNRD